MYLKTVTSTDGNDAETNLLERLAVEHKTTVKDESGSWAVVVDYHQPCTPSLVALLTLLPVERLELVPLGADDDSLGILARFQSRLADVEVRLDGLGGDRSVVGEVEPDLRLGDLRVVDGDSGLFTQKVVGDRDGRGFTRVSSVLLEGPSEDGNLLTSDAASQLEFDWKNAPLTC